MGVLRDDAGAAALTLAHPEPAEPTTKARRARKPRASSKPAHWPPSPEAEAVLRRILEALAVAREAAGWPRGWGPKSQLRRDAHNGLALRLSQLIEDGEPEAEAEALLIATMQAKCFEQKRRRGRGPQDVAARSGQYATALSICRDVWWASNLAAGRAWAAGGPPVVTSSGRERARVEHDEGTLVP